MKKVIASIRIALLLAAVTLAGTALFPNEASALKSCEYYCGPAGPTVCTCGPSQLHCTWDIEY